MDKSIQAGLAALIALALGLPQTAYAGDKDPLAGFVVLGQTGKGQQVALARVVIDKAGADCPSLAPAASGDAETAMVARPNPDPTNFDVTVCEAVYPLDGSRMDVHGSSLQLPPVPAQVSRVAVFGDTGCKPSDQDGCDKDKDWPFGEMAAGGVDLAKTTPKTPSRSASTMPPQSASGSASSAIWI